ncbi:hypothetical protein WICPIJ_000649 [Wickerhamomyces pijperi]|uniref:Uncharacterized protein n=1 Tax=Wickerhamomyces pijperi TaxID=599730 RepID=A0A9P8QFU6_WICPI|nr:hypothetical protein WICPIJ_000649 [Wickerhamomyces pijperi]
MEEWREADLEISGFSEELEPNNLSKTISAPNNALYLLVFLERYDSEREMPALELSGGLISNDFNSSLSALSWMVKFSKASVMRIGDLGTIISPSAEERSTSGMLNLPLAIEETEVRESDLAKEVLGNSKAGAELRTLLPLYS